VIRGHAKVAVPVDDQDAGLGVRGVPFAAQPASLHFGWWSMFEDPEGTRFALGRWRR
jgi:hypothetical protein